MTKYPYLCPSHIHTHPQYGVWRHSVKGRYIQQHASTLEFFCSSFQLVTYKQPLSWEPHSCFNISNILGPCQYDLQRCCVQLLGHSIVLIHPYSSVLVSLQQIQCISKAPGFISMSALSFPNRNLLTVDVIQMLV